MDIKLIRAIYFNLVLFYRFVKFFIAHGCDTFIPEKEGLLPLDICLSTQWDYCNWKNYMVLNTLLDDMFAR